MRFFPIVGIGLLLLLLLSSCDDGRIYGDEVVVDREGGSATVTGHIEGLESWASGYSIVFAGFSEDSEYAKTAKGISAGADGSMHVSLSGIPVEVTRLEICAINRLRRRVATFYSTSFTSGADTVRLEAGEVDASMFGAIQAEVFDRSCTACHGGSTEAAGGLFLTEGHSYDALVNVEADLSPEGLMLVEPGVAEASFLHQVLREDVVRYDHTQIITSSMLLDLVDNWIKNGAIE